MLQVFFVKTGIFAYLALKKKLQIFNNRNSRTKRPSTEMVGTLRF